MMVDVDVLFNANAPPFHTLDIGAKIGVVDEWCQPSREARVYVPARQRAGAERQRILCACRLRSRTPRY